MKLIPALTVIALLASTSAFAGAANAELKCQSADGLVIEGSVPGDFAEFDVTVSKNGQSARLFSTLNQSSSETEENATLTVVESTADGVWTLSSYLNGENTYGYLQMFALPKTVKYKRLANGYSAKFTAKTSLNLPGIDGDNFGVKLSCSLYYSI